VISTDVFETPAWNYLWYWTCTHKQDWSSWWFGFFQVSIVDASCSIVDRFDSSTCHVASGAGDLLQFHERPTWLCGFLMCNKGVAAVTPVIVSTSKIESNHHSNECTLSTGSKARNLLRRGMKFRWVQCCRVAKGSVHQIVTVWKKNFVGSIE
jgi:hypothetical protein